MHEHSKHSQPRKSAVRLILIDGLLVKGGLFALWMLFAGFLIERSFDGSGLVDYLASGKTWMGFLFYFLGFGLFVGLDNWFGNKGSRIERYKIT